MVEMTRRGDEPSSCVRGCCVSSRVDLEVDLQEVRRGEPRADWTAQGSTSVLQRGTFRGQDVAVKLPSLKTSDDLDRFHKELSVHLDLLDMDHKHLAKIVGCRARPPHYAFILPLARMDLRQVLYGKEYNSLRLVDLICIAVQVARGVTALHEKGYVHRDLKPANVLITDQFEAKVADFGLVERESVLESHFSAASQAPTRQGRRAPSGGTHKRLMVGTLEYMAPEVLTHEGQTRKSDVYSLGVLVNEILTGVVPFSDCIKGEPGCRTILEMHYGRQELKAAVVGAGLRPTLGGGIPKDVSDLIARCWSADPSERPSAKAFTHELEAILSRQMPSDEEVSDVFLVNPRKPLPEEASSPLSPTSSTSTVITTDASMFGKGVQGSDWMSYAEEMSVAGNQSTASKALDMDVGLFQTIGQRDAQEDRVVHVESFMSRWELIAVFDGHRGSEASAFCAENIECVLKNALFLVQSTNQHTKEEDNVIREAMQLTFEELDQAFRACHPGSNAGATGLVALLTGSKVFVANCGDCRCIVGGKSRAKPLSRDHTAGCEEERNRILTTSGCASAVQFQYGSWRVGGAGLEVTRSLGDADLKQLGVTALPEVVVHDFAQPESRQDEFVVLASDGLWDCLTSEEVCGLVYDTVKHPGMVAQRLASEAQARGSSDNISVAVGFLSKNETCEMIYEEGQHKYAFTRTFHASRA